MKRIATVMLSILIGGMVGVGGAAGAAERNPLAGLGGSWSGSGSARFDGGRRERLACRGSYSVKRGGAHMGMALRCASASVKIDLRSQIQYARGRVTGSWEERSFNASGSVAGRASPGHMAVSFQGGGIAGGMSVSFSGSSQSISINSSGSSFNGVSIRLHRR